MLDRNPKSSREHVALLNRIIAATRADFRECRGRAKDEESRSLVDTLESRIVAALQETQSRVSDAKICPDLPLRLTIHDSRVHWSDEVSCTVRRVGFFATSGDPFYWGHIYVCLCAILELDLHTVVIQVMGDHPHKRDIKQSKEHRHEIARRALEYFFPVLRYTSLGFANMKIGEENASELLLLNNGLPLEVFYIAGGDVHEIAAANLAACRTLLKPRDGSETPRLRGLLFPRAESGTSAEELLRSHPFLEIAKREYEPFPKVRGQELSSSMFRANPETPILPSRALDYILDQGLYRAKT